MKKFLVIGYILLVACSADYPNKHLAKCEIDWRSTPDRVKEEWGENEYSYLKDCMDANDFAYNDDNPSCLLSVGGALPFCYSSRQSTVFWVKHLLQPR